MIGVASSYGANGKPASYNSSDTTGGWSTSKSSCESIIPKSTGSIPFGVITETAMGRDGRQVTVRKTGVTERGNGESAQEHEPLSDQLLSGSDRCGGIEPRDAPCVPLCARVPVGCMGLPLLGEDRSSYCLWKNFQREGGSSWDECVHSHRHLHDKCGVYFDFCVYDRCWTVCCPWCLSCP